MKKFFIATGILLVIVGLILVCIFGSMRGFEGMKNGFTHDISNTDAYKSVTVDSNAQLDLNISSNSYSVYLRSSAENESQVRIKYLSEMLSKGATIDVSANGNSVSIEEDDESKWFPLSFLNDFYGRKRFIVVEVPVGIEVNIQVTSNVGKFDVRENIGLILGDVYCKLSAGSVAMESVSAGDLTLITEAGSISLNEVTSKTIVLKSQAGSVNVDSVWCSELDIYTAAGSVKVLKTSAANMAKIEVAAGSATCNIETETLNISSDAGSISFNTNAKSIRLESDLGSVSGTVSRPKSDYNITVEKGMGSSNISSVTSASAVGEMHVKVDMGSINIKFES